MIKWNYDTTTSIAVDRIKESPKNLTFPKFSTTKSYPTVYLVFF